MIPNDFVFNTGETQGYLREKYNPEGSTLRKAQLRMLDMLQYLDYVCKKLAIPYSLDGGNILGAIRHGGFIPWDDDVDIIISRKHLNALNNYLESNPHPQYVLQNHKTDDGYLGCWIVLRDLKSEYLQDSTLHNIRKYRGLQIDIFAMEIGLNKSIHWLAYAIHHCFVEKNIYKKRIKLAKLFYIICDGMFFPIIRCLCKIFGNNKKLMYPLGTKWDWRYDFNTIFPVSNIEFEGIELSSINNPTKFLREHYGNYMNLPPSNMRNHHNATYKIWD